MRVLHFYLWGQFYPVTCGSDYVVKNQMSYFQHRGWEVHCLVPRNYGPGFPDPEAVLRAYPCVKTVETLDFHKCETSFRDLLLGLNSAAESVAFRDLAAQDFDIFFANYILAAPLAHAMPKTCFKVVETIDILSRLFRGISQHTDPSYAPPAVQDAEVRFMIRRVECELYRLFDRAVMISEDETREVYALGCSHARYVPQMFPVAAEPLRGAVANEAYDLLFVGGNNPFNRDALEWFFQHVFLPYLVQHDVRFAVAGQVAAYVDIDHPLLKKLGHYPGSIDELYGASKIAVVPILQGTGISIKFCEAMAAGCAVVSTPIGARGFGNDPAAFACLDMKANPQETAAVILDLLRDDDRRRAMEANSLTLMRTRHSRDAYFRAMDEVFSPMLEQRRTLQLAGLIATARIETEPPAARKAILAIAQVVSRTASTPPVIRGRS